MIASQRSIYIMEQLKKKSVIDLKEIAKAVNASESTIRRDIERLEKQGKLKRVLGGAELANLPAPDTDVAELTMAMRQKSNMHMEEKLLVARRAVEFVKDGDCVFLDGGTSGACLMESLAQKRICLVTNNQLALQRAVNPVATIVSIGGIYLPHFNMTVGALAEGLLGNFHFNHAFITCSSVNLAEGMCYTSELDTIGIKRLATQYADNSYLLIDSSKLSFRAFCKCMPLDSFDRVLCDAVDPDVELPENFMIVNDGI